MKDKIQKLTNEIDRLLSGEIMKLQFGCELRIGGLRWTVLWDGKSSLPDGSKQEKGIIGYSDFFSETRELEDYDEILGRPINLEDVMRAIDKIYFGINETNEGFILSDEIVGVIGIWELGKPLSEQSPETIQSIAEILNVK